MQESEPPRMSQAPTAYVPRPRSATLGNILGDSLGIYFRHLIPILLVAAAVFLPFAALQNQAWNRMAEAPDFIDRLQAGQTGQSPFIPVISLGLQFVLQGFVIYIVVQQLSGRSPSIGVALSVGIRRMLPALGVVFCIGLCFAAMILPAIAVPPLGLILLIPIIIVGCGLFVSIAASVMERPGILGALGRSWELTRGRRGTIFLMLLVVFIVAGIVAHFMQRSVLRGVTLENLLSKLHELTWMNTAVQAIFYSFLSVCAGVTYHHLRTSKEGVAAEDLVAIFD